MIGSRLTYTDNRYPKYRYVYILGNRKQKKDILNKLKYNKLPYVKL